MNPSKENPWKGGCLLDSVRPEWVNLNLNAGDHPWPIRASILPAGLIAPDVLAVNDGCVRSRAVSCCAPASCRCVSSSLGCKTFDPWPSFGEDWTNVLLVVPTASAFSSCPLSAQVELAVARCEMTYISFTTTTLKADKLM